MRVGSTKALAILNRVVGVSFIERVAFKQSLARGQGGTIWIPGERG